jgi:lipopolysaccharide assembly protein B
MEFEAWWLLLLPTFFAAGWFAARWDLRQTIRAARQLPASYFKGVNHLLHDEPDQAMSALIEVVKQDPETPELHFALGALMRRRGETDRAIAVHENLLSRRDLTEEHRQQARYELGLDFVKAGLLDQAEKAFAQLEGTELAVPAEEQRILIAQTVRDWPLAIQMAEALRKAGHTQAAEHEVQYHCNLIEQQLQNGQSPNWSGLESIGSTHPRVALTQLADCLQRRDRDGIIAALDKLANENPEAFVLGLESLQKAVKAHLFDLSDETKATSLLGEKAQQWWVKTKSPAMLEAAIGFGIKASWLETALKETPSIKAVSAYLKSTENLQPLESELAEQIHRLAAFAPRYTCRSCGFQGRQHYWQCPGCAQWDSYPFSPH